MNKKGKLEIKKRRIVANRERKIRQEIWEITVIIRRGRREVTKWSKKRRNVQWGRSIKWAKIIIHLIIGRKILVRKNEDFEKNWVGN